MDLKKFLAMSEEEQEAIWKVHQHAMEMEFPNPEDQYAWARAPRPKSLLREKRHQRIIDAEKRLEEQETPHHKQCCALKDTLIKQLKDEEEGTSFYAQMSGELTMLGEVGLAELLNHISDNEFKHYVELRGIIDILTEQCDCYRENLGAPFG